MDAIRSLVGVIFQDAKRLSHQLMFGWEPPQPDFHRIRDRLSTTATGYSFVTDPANTLEERYLDVLRIGCLSSSTGLMRKTKLGQGVWNSGAAAAYLENHDCLLKQIMLLINLSGGQGSRISELLTIEHTSTPTRLRGCGFYKGHFCTVTRHNKTRTTTNSEFQVVRFIPDSVRMLLFNYLVYIRRVARTIKRYAFQRTEDTTLLFSPAASSQRWTSQVYSKELERYTKEHADVGFEIGAQRYRQLSIAITDRHVCGAAKSFNRYEDTVRNGNVSAAFAWQSGHKLPQRLSTYGLDGAYPDQLQPALLQIFLDISRQWHYFLRLDGADDGTAAADRSTWPKTPTERPTPYARSVRWREA